MDMDWERNVYLGGYTKDYLMLNTTYPVDNSKPILISLNANGVVRWSKYYISNDLLDIVLSLAHS